MSIVLLAQVSRGRALALSFQLRQRMLHFLHNFLYYMMFEVIEPNWHTMMERLRTVRLFHVLIMVSSSVFLAQFG
eukprot:SAG31_NODE_3383_length_4335_cov_2.093012_4_plen_75_part_00